MAATWTDQIFEDIVEAIRDPLLLLDSDLKVILANQSFINSFEVTREETVGNFIYDLGNKQWDIPRLRELLETILSQKSSFDNYEVEQDFATIGKRTMLLNARRIEQTMGKERIILLVIEDITERKRLEDLLVDSEERYRRLFETATDGILLLEKSKGNIVRANPSIKEILGYSNNEISGKDLKDIGFPDDIETIQEILQTLERDGIIHYKDFSLKKKNGQFIDTDIYMVDKAILVQCNIRDITERKKADEALLHSERKYRTLVENANEAIFVAQEQKLVFVNPIMSLMTGYSAEELQTRPFIEFIHQDDREMVFDRHARRLKGEELPHLYPFRVLNKDGSIMWGELNAVLINWDGKPATLNFLTDITERKRAEEEREELVSQLIQAHKMGAIGTLAGGIAHDFNNILSPIMLHTEMAMMDLPPDSPLQMNMKQIYKSGERARDLVHQILTFARAKEEQRIPLKASLIVKEAVKFLRATIPTTIDLQFDIRTDRDTVLADPTQMHQIVMNLCTNAFHAMQERGGELEVALTEIHVTTEEAILFGDIVPGDYLRITISDTGAGISPDIMDKIFEPYFTTKSQGEGTGLGLAVVHGIVKSWGGHIRVESEVGKGTVFQVILPIVDAEVSLTKDERADLPRGTERVLVIDDEAAAVTAVQSILERLGYAVTAKTRSIEALEAFRNNPGGFDLVITDMTMPNMTGKELAMELMAIRPDIPVILCTGFSEKIGEKRAKEMGIRGFIMKPILTSQIANTIREVLDQK